MCKKYFFVFVFLFSSSWVAQANDLSGGAKGLKPGLSQKAVENILVSRFHLDAKSIVCFPIKADNPKRSFADLLCGTSGYGLNGEVATLANEPVLRFQFYYLKNRLKYFSAQLGTSHIGDSKVEAMKLMGRVIESVKISYGDPYVGRYTSAWQDINADIMFGVRRISRENELVSVIFEGMDGHALKMLAKENSDL